MKARAQVAMESNNRDSLKRFNALLEANTQQKDAAHYGLALTYIKLNNFEAAGKLLGSLLFNNPYQLAFQYSDIELDIAQEDYKGALSKLTNLIKQNPGNSPLLSLKAEALWLDHQYERSSDVLTVLSRQRKEDPMIWYRSAEVRGLAGNISGVHEARAESVILVGAFTLARAPLSLALKLVLAAFQRSSVLMTRLRTVVNMDDSMESL